MYASSYYVPNFITNSQNNSRSGQSRAVRPSALSPPRIRFIPSALILHQHPGMVILLGGTRVWQSGKIKEQDSEIRPYDKMQEGRKEQDE